MNKGPNKHKQYSNNDYLNKRINSFTDSEYYADRTLFIYCEEHLKVPSANDLKKEIKRLKSWLYKSSQHREQLSTYQKGLSYMIHIGIPTYLATR